MVTPRDKHISLEREEILAALTAFVGVTTADGATPANNTLICSELIGANDFITGKVILIGDLNAEHEDHGATIFDPLTGQITVDSGYSAQIVAGTTFRVLTVRSLAVAMAVLAALYEQTPVPVNINAIAASETNVLLLNDPAQTYVVRSLRLKAVDPVANIITVRLYELVNGALTMVDDSFTIRGSGDANPNFATHHSLMDMFGLQSLAGRQLQVTVRVSGGGPYAVTGQYSYAKAQA